MRGVIGYCVGRRYSELVVALCGLGRMGAGRLGGERYFGDDPGRGVKKNCLGTLPDGRGSERVRACLQGGVANPDWSGVDHGRARPWLWQGDWRC